MHIKIADYGISRIALPTGTKGFGGTEGFMAPEIICHNGEEEYTEKVIFRAIFDHFYIFMIDWRGFSRSNRALCEIFIQSIEYSFDSSNCDVSGRLFFIWHVNI